jgi:NAD(P) transhydrogenase
MLEAMKRGSVIVDLAAANGGNVEASVADDVVETEGGVTIVGWTDLPSRLPATSSNLFSNNVKNFLLSVGPQTTNDKGYYYVDTTDPAVDNMMIVKDGVVRWGKEVRSITKTRTPHGHCKFSNSKHPTISNASRFARLLGCNDALQGP